MNELPPQLHWAKTQTWNAKAQVTCVVQLILNQRISLLGDFGFVIFSPFIIHLLDTLTKGSPNPVTRLTGAEI